MLNRMLTEASQINTAADPYNAALKYLQWAEMVELQMENVTTDLAAITMLETPRYLQISNLENTVTGAVAWNMIETELRRQTKALEALRDDLRARANRAASGSGSIFVLDSNILLHHAPLDQVPWVKLTGEDEIRLVVPLRVIEELDEKKYAASERLRGRARNVLPKLDEALGPKGGTGELGKGVTIEVPVDPGPRDRPLDADREVLDACHELRQFSGRTTTLITGDTGMRRRAQAEGIPVFVMPPEYRRDKDMND
jgi:rRNA-processing protein FCF1